MNNIFWCFATGANSCLRPQNSTASIQTCGTATEQITFFFFVPKTPRKRPPRGVKLTNENFGFRRFPYAGVVPLVKKFTARAGMVAWSNQA